MLPDRVSNPGPLTYESDALPIALRGPAYEQGKVPLLKCCQERHIRFSRLYHKFSDYDNYKGRVKRNFPCSSCAMNSKISNKLLQVEPK